VSKILAERAARDFMSSAGGTTEFTTVLPGAVFGPILSAENLGSVQIIQGLLKGQPAARPRLGFWVVDVRDLADLHIRAMTSQAAAGQRFIAAGQFALRSLKARQILEFSPRPAATTVVDCAPSRISGQKVPFDMRL
jgi:nucleoside-diphosphate-sugar epimerase